MVELTENIFRSMSRILGEARESKIKPAIVQNWFIPPVLLKLAGRLTEKELYLVEFKVISSTLKLINSRLSLFIGENLPLRIKYLICSFLKS